jgi:hypothetical protein
LLGGLLSEPTHPPALAVTCHDEGCRDHDPFRLLIAAQKPLETLSEELEGILEKADGELAAAAEAALLNVVGRLAKLRARIECLSQAPVRAQWPW